jgi:hypothetical protein
MAQKHTPDRKVRVKGNRVIHTTRGGVYHGDVAERPRGLTTEQAEDQRVGSKLDERQTREAAQRAIEAKPRRTTPKTDELTAAPYGKKPTIKKK